jgi:hypothetical protein
MRTQTERVLAYLRSGETLTAIDALGIIGTFRLAARVADAKKLLEPDEEIVTERVALPSRKVVARYSLRRTGPKQMTWKEWA